MNFLLSFFGKGLASSYDRKQKVASIFPARVACPPTRRKAWHKVTIKGKICVNCVRPDTGLGIVEVLVASGLGILVGMFALDTLGVAVRTTQTQKTALEEQVLSVKMSRFLSDESNCKYILKPKKLDDKDNQKGLVYKVSKEDGKLFKTIKGFNPELIEVKGMELLNEGTDNTYPQRNLAVFYEKLFVKGQETLSGEECDLSDPSALKKAGCYFQTCILDYECSNNNCDGANDKCKPLSCHSGEVTELTQDSVVNAIRSLCEAGEILTYKTVDGQKTKRCLPLLNLSPDPDEPGIRCPQGKVIRTIKANGELVCDWPKLCGEKQVWSDVDEKCRCIDDLVEEGPPTYRFCCKTEGDYYHNGACQYCKEGDYYHNGACQYCKEGDYYHNGGCQACSEEHYSDGTCQVCNKVFYINGQCWPPKANVQPNENNLPEAIQWEMRDRRGDDNFSPFNIDTFYDNDEESGRCHNDYIDWGICRPCPFYFYHHDKCQTCFNNNQNPKLYHHGGCQACEEKFYHNGGCQPCEERFYRDGACRP